ncbi:type II toxin-antitoxin system ParD family antitoxin [Methylosinus sp. RM1]|uniref:ribbon-helix-helix domain-containing protein n=1 Tax=Methylosinus sp. RM1 TaxID=2583817 RepID=UPI00140C8535|nr:type II toxin-antitoxin system ParD family antitoxin [Methylosinus sp. RM1]
MRSTQQFSVTLPTEMAQLVKMKVSSGEYASESEVIRDSLRALLARDRAVENWLSQEVAPAYDRMKIDPSRGRSPADVRAALAAEHEQATKTTP